jgi:hypothetical protein
MFERCGDAISYKQKKYAIAYCSRFFLLTPEYVQINYKKVSRSAISGLKECRVSIIKKQTFHACTPEKTAGCA